MADNGKNTTSGLGFEHEMCGFLAEYGFWAHRIVPSANGQPFDIIAVRKSDGKAFAIECKVVGSENCRMRTSRIEDNQAVAMNRFPGMAWFAFKRHDGSIWFTSACALLYSMNMPTIPAGRIDREEWLERYSGLDLRLKSNPRPKDSEPM